MHFNVACALFHIVTFRRSSWSDDDDTELIQTCYDYLSDRLIVLLPATINRLLWRTIIDYRLTRAFPPWASPRRGGRQRWGTTWVWNNKFFLRPMVFSVGPSIHSFTTSCPRTSFRQYLRFDLGTLCLWPWAATGIFENRWSWLRVLREVIFLMGRIARHGTLEDAARRIIAINSRFFF